LEIGS